MSIKYDEQRGVVRCDDGFTFTVNSKKRIELDELLFANDMARFYACLDEMNIRARRRSSKLRAWAWSALMSE